MQFAIDDLKSMFAQLAAKLEQEKDRLCEIDGLIGDADHGIAMDEGMRAAALAVGQLADGSTLQDGFNAAAKAFLNAVGASSGPLYATAFMRAGKAAGPRQSMPRDDVRQIIIAMAEGIAQRGKAEPGQKTMVDAWHPAARAASEGASPSGISAAAIAGARSTVLMVASLGRASRLGERALGFEDPGAVSAAMIINVMTGFID